MSGDRIIRKGCNQHAESIEALKNLCLDTALLKLCFRWQFPNTNESPGLAELSTESGVSTKFRVMTYSVLLTLC